MPSDSVKKEEKKEEEGGGAEKETGSDFTRVHFIGKYAFYKTNNRYSVWLEVSV